MVQKSLLVDARYAIRSVAKGPAVVWTTSTVNPLSVSSIYARIDESPTVFINRGAQVPVALKPHSIEPADYRVNYVIDSADITNSNFRFEVYTLKPGRYMMSLDLEWVGWGQFQPNWDFTKPWTVTLRPAVGVKIITDWIIKSVGWHEATNIAQIVAQCAVVVTEQWVPNIEVGFRATVPSGDISDVILGFRLEIVASVMSVTYPLQAESQDEFELVEPTDLKDLP